MRRAASWRERSSRRARTTAVATAVAALALAAASCQAGERDEATVGELDPAGATGELGGAPPTAPPVRGGGAAEEHADPAEEPGVDGGPKQVAAEPGDKQVATSAAVQAGASPPASRAHHDRNGHAHDNRDEHEHAAGSEQSGGDADDGHGREDGDDGHDHGGEGEGASPRRLPPSPFDDVEPALPDLVPRPAYHVVVGEPDGPLTGVDAAMQEAEGEETAEEPVEGPVLRFTTTIDNLSEHAFEILAHPGEPDSEDPDFLTTDAYQCLRFEGPQYEGAQRACRAYEQVGQLHYHAHHRHLHLDGFARYELRYDQDGEPMPGSDGVAAVADKVGWCVSDMERPRRSDGTEATYDPWYVECSRIPMPFPARMGISPAWGDTYFWGFPGQQLPLDGVADGVYWIGIHINPPDNAHGLELHEADGSRNTSWTKVRLTDGASAVEVLAERHPAPDHYSAAPEYMRDRRYPDGHEPGNRSEQGGEAQ